MHINVVLECAFESTPLISSLHSELSVIKMGGLSMLPSYVLSLFLNQQCKLKDVNVVS
jgi:hypothetical protein